MSNWPVHLALLRCCALAAVGAAAAPVASRRPCEPGAALARRELAPVAPAGAGLVATAVSTRAGEPEAEGAGGEGCASALEWLIFVEASVLLAAVELRLFGQLSGGVRAYCALAAFWICSAACFNAYVWKSRGPEQGLLWFGGYCLELMLSFDNLLAFGLIFRAYRTPRELMHAALLFGIGGSLCLRLALLMAVGPAVRLDAWARTTLGVALMCSGAGAAFCGGEEEGDVADAFAVRLLKRCLGPRLDDRYPAGEGRFLIVEDGKVRVTLLAFVVICLQVVDLVFALDSISAKVAAVPDLYSAFTSTVAATFVLRALFFVLDHLAEMLTGVQYGAGFVVTFIGVRLLLDDWLHMPAWCVSVVAGAVLLACLLLSAALHARRSWLGGSLPLGVCHSELPPTS